jgi:hypothetical protein
MKKVVIFLLLFIICGNVYSSGAAGKKWWEFWKYGNNANEVTVRAEKNKVNHFVNYNWIYDVEIDGDNVIFTSTGGIIHLDTKTGKYTYEEKPSDQKEYGMHVGPWMNQDLLPAWFVKDEYTRVLSVSYRGPTVTLMDPNKAVSETADTEDSKKQKYILIRSSKGHGIIDLIKRKSFLFEGDTLLNFAVKDNIAWIGSRNGIIRLDMKSNIKTNYVTQPEYLQILGIAEYVDKMLYTTEAGVFKLDKQNGIISAVEAINKYCKNRKIALLAMKQDGEKIYLAGFGEILERPDDNITRGGVFIAYDTTNDAINAINTGIGFTDSIIVLDKYVLVYGYKHEEGEEGEMATYGGAYIYDKSSDAIERTIELPIFSVSPEPGGFSAKTIIEDLEFVIDVDWHIDLEKKDFQILNARYFPEINKYNTEEYGERMLKKPEYLLKMIEQYGGKTIETKIDHEIRKRFQNEVAGAMSGKYLEYNACAKFLYNFNVKSETIKTEESTVEAIQY